MTKKLKFSVRIHYYGTENHVLDEVCQVCGMKTCERETVQIFNPFKEREKNVPRVCVFAITTQLFISLLGMCVLEKLIV